MPPVVCFIGWHNSGKTTLTRQVVSHLKTKGYAVAVIKSTKERGIVFDPPATDTALYKQAGAEAVALLAPDQLVIQRQPPGLALHDLAQRLFPETDIVIAEGFKHAAQVPKIEVRRDPDAPLLRDQVEGVIALATDLPAGSGRCFHLNQSGEIADFIETRFLNEPRAGEPRWLLTLNGTPLALPHTTREQLRPLLAAVLPPNTQGTMVLTMTYPETDEE